MIKWRVTCAECPSSFIEFSNENEAIEFKNLKNGSIEQITEEDAVEDKSATQDKLLEACWAFITPYFDNASFIQILDWKNTFQADHQIQPYIKAIEYWKSAIMFEYLMVKKPSMYAGLPYDFNYSFVGSPPCKFTDLFLIANPSLQVYASDWSAPDITNYQPGSRQNPKEITF
jgi:hypothetical protein